MNDPAESDSMELLFSKEIDDLENTLLAFAKDFEIQDQVKELRDSLAVK